MPLLLLILPQRRGWFAWLLALGLAAAATFIGFKTLRGNAAPPVESAARDAVIRLPAELAPALVIRLTSDLGSVERFDAAAAKLGVTMPDGETARLAGMPRVTTLSDAPGELHVSLSGADPTTGGVGAGLMNLVAADAIQAQRAAWQAAAASEAASGAAARNAGAENLAAAVEQLSKASEAAMSAAPTASVEHKEAPAPRAPMHQPPRIVPSKTPATLAELEARYARLLETRTPTHPEVQQAARELAEARRAAAQPAGANPPRITIGGPAATASTSGNQPGPTGAQLVALAASAERARAAVDDLRSALSTEQAAWTRAISLPSVEVVQWAAASQRNTPKSFGWPLAALLGFGALMVGLMAAAIMLRDHFQNDAFAQAQQLGGSLGLPVVGVMTSDGFAKDPPSRLAGLKGLMPKLIRGMVTVLLALVIGGGLGAAIATALRHVNSRPAAQRAPTPSSVVQR